MPINNQRGLSCVRDVNRWVFLCCTIKHRFGNRMRIISLLKHPSHILLAHTHTHANFVSFSPTDTLFFFSLVLLRWLVSLIPFISHTHYNMLKEKRSIVPVLTMMMHRWCYNGNDWNVHTKADAPNITHAIEEQWEVSPRIYPCAQKGRLRPSTLADINKVGGVLQGSRKVSWW